MAKACKVCKGRGRWLEETVFQTNAGQMVEHVWRECLNCNSTGVEQDPEEGEDFDIGGDSYDDDD